MKTISIAMSMATLSVLSAVASTAAAAPKSSYVVLKHTAPTRDALADCAPQGDCEPLAAQQEKRQGQKACASTPSCVPEQ